MESTHTWFCQAIQLGSTVRLTWPDSPWKIVRQLMEHDHQKLPNYVTGSSPSYASITLLCANTEKSRKARMRIYMQVPNVSTELLESSLRPKQAAKFTPIEPTSFKTFTRKGKNVTPRLLGYRAGKQDSTGLIPGGFMIYLVWDIVPGFRLGDYSGAVFCVLESERSYE